VTLERRWIPTFVGMTGEITISNYKINQPATRMDIGLQADYF
jgi:hypothetical protein